MGALLEPLLELSGVEAGYGAGPVLHGVSFTLAEGEVGTLMGRNGMGKTTTVRAIAGLLRPSAGTIRLAGEPIERAAPHRVARLGLGLVPEGRRIFPNLTVRENLLMAAMDPRRWGGRGEPWTLARVLAFLPRLAERLENGGTQLSGGEQQMLAIGRALMTNPRLLVLDEATEGLAPLIREEIWARLHELAATGLSILVIDKEVEALRALAHRHHVLERGEVVWSGDGEALDRDAKRLDAYLSV